MQIKNIKKDIEDLLRERQATATAITSENCTTMESSTISDKVSLKKDDESLFLYQNIEDRITNRDQRVRIARKIFIMMVWEVSVVGFLLLGLFAVPYINATAPIIKINLPPIFLSLSIIVCYCFIIKYIDLLPNIFISCKFLHLRKTIVNISALGKAACIISIFILLNILPRKSYILHFQQIQLSESITDLILYTAIAVFGKTTYLGHCIIKSLYDLMKNHKLN